MQDVLKLARLVFQAHDRIDRDGVLKRIEYYSKDDSATARGILQGLLAHGLVELCGSEFVEEYRLTEHARTFEGAPGLADGPKDRTVYEEYQFPPDPGRPVGTGELVKVPANTPEAAATRKACREAWQAVERARIGL
jgi:hypothetical protein